MLSRRTDSLVALALASLSLAACTAAGSQTIVQGGPAPAPGESVACAAGTMTTVDGASCTPVGPTAIPRGFEVNAEGWGFHAVRSAKACTADTRAGLGETTCLPVDDCDAPFPPAGAVVVRDGDAVALRQAISSARAGTTVAVDSGTYDVTAKPAFAMPSDVRIVGRCAREVVIRGAGDNNAFGFERGTLRLESLTFSNFYETMQVSGPTAVAEITNVVFDGNNAAVFADAGGRATVRRSVIDGKRSSRTAKDTVRGLVAFPGGSITIEDSELRDIDRPFTALKEKAQIDVRRTIATGRGLDEDVTVLAVYGGKITIEESSITSERGQFLGVGISHRDNDESANDDASVTVVNSELSQPRGYMELGFGSAAGGSSIVIEGSTIHHSSPTALAAFEGGSRVSLRTSVITLADVGTKDGFGASALSGGQLEVEGSAIIGARGVGINATGDGSRLTVSSSLVLGTTAGPSASDVGGLRSQSMGIEVAHDAVATLTGSVMADNDQAGLVVGSRARAQAEGIVVQGTKAWGEGGLGHGEGITLFADGNLSLHASVVRGNAQVGFLAMRSSGVVEGTRFERNLGGVEVWETAVRNGASGDAPGDRELVLVENVFTETGTDVKVTVEGGPAMAADR